MTQTSTFRFNKLVRDKAIELMKAEGVEADSYIMNHADYITALKAKLVEEAKEASEASDNELPEELADVLEVLYSLAKAYGYSLADIELERINKSQRRGSFEKKIYIKNATTKSGNRFFDYYRSKPKEYVEL